jgi:hypothetical protein
MKKLVLIGYLSLMSIASGICNDSLVGSICLLKKGSEIIPDLSTDESYLSTKQILVTVTGETGVVGNDYAIIRYMDKILYVHAEDLRLITTKDLQRISPE